MEDVGFDRIDFSLHLDDLRTSLITHPDNGRLPALVEGVRRVPTVEDVVAASRQPRTGAATAVSPEALHRRKRLLLNCPLDGEAYGRAKRVRSSLPGPGTATVMFPGTAPRVPAYTVKVHATFPAETSVIRGVLCLHDVTSGDLLAVMGSTYLTAVRTELAGALPGM